MVTPSQTRIRDLLDRLARVMAAQDWSDALNPAQRGALAYLARANRFSRSPSHVADYLCTTRGTASQTLKSLEKKGFVARMAIPGDARSIAYGLTETGERALAETGGDGTATDALDARQAAMLERLLAQLLTERLQQRGFRSFGLCRTCRHHQTGAEGRYCRLLEVALGEAEADQICHEHAPA